MNSGLYALAGASATATAAACAKRLDAPMTKVSKRYFGFSRASARRDRAPARAARASGPRPARPVPRTAVPVAGAAGRWQLVAVAAVAAAARSCWCSGVLRLPVVVLRLLGTAARGVRVARPGSRRAGLLPAKSSCGTGPGAGLGALLLVVRVGGAGRRQCRRRGPVRRSRRSRRLRAGSYGSSCGALVAGRLLALAGAGASAGAGRGAAARPRSRRR